jgi:hypothetical protein
MFFVVFYQFGSTLMSWFDWILQSVTQNTERFMFLKTLSNKQNRVLETQPDFSQSRESFYLFGDKTIKTGISQIVMFTSSLPFDGQIKH